MSLKINKSKVSYLRLIVRSKRLMRQPKGIGQSTFEREILVICRNLIHNSYAELQIHPETGERYIMYGQFGTNVVINGNKITLSTDSSHYEIIVSDKGLTSLLTVFDSHIKNKLGLVQNRIELGTSNTLKTIAASTNFK